MSTTHQGPDLDSDLTGKTVVITGASSGIGATAARRLARRGATVIAVGRSPERTAAVAAELGTEPVIGDFARLDDVERVAAELTARLPRIDVLANNAGGVFGDPTKTVDGFERTFQINHLAPFLLTHLLMDILTASGASVLQTSSVAARRPAKVVIEDLNLDRNFSPIRAYGAAKLANILFTQELHRRFHARGVSSAAFHPGNVATRFGSQSRSRLMKFITTNPVTRGMLITPEKGSDHLVWLAGSRAGADWDSGTYYEKFRPSRSVNPQARDAELARQFWEKSQQLLGDRLPVAVQD